MKSLIDKAQRLWKIPGPALGSMKFAEKRLSSRGVDLIDLETVRPHISPDLVKALEDIKPAVTGLAADRDTIEKLKSSIAENHQPLRSTGIDPETEILITPGIRLTASLLALALLNPDDAAAYPDPGMQYFRTAICMADAVPRPYALVERNDYILNMAALTERPAKKLRILFLNYPHNPTATCVDYYFYRDLLKSLKFENILVVCDSAYIHPGDSEAVSILQVKSSRKKAIELHSFSTAFGIDGLGFAVGHKDVVSILESFLAALGYKPDFYRARAALAALDRTEELFHRRSDLFAGLRGMTSSKLKESGWRIRGCPRTPFLWVKPPARGSSLAFARRLVTKAGVRLAPGTDFGEAGEGWLRLTLHPDEKTLSEALKRISRHSRLWQRKYRPERSKKGE